MGRRDVHYLFLWQREADRAGHASLETDKDSAGGRHKRAGGHTDTCRSHNRNTPAHSDSASRNKCSAENKPTNHMKKITLVITPSHVLSESKSRRKLQRNISITERLTSRSSSLWATASRHSCPVLSTDSVHSITLLSCRRIRVTK